MGQVIQKVTTTILVNQFGMTDVALGADQCHVIFMPAALTCYT